LRTASDITPTSPDECAASSVFPRFAAPVPGVTVVTSTSPISTPELAASLPIAFVPAPKTGLLSTDTLSWLLAFTFAPRSLPAASRIVPYRLRLADILKLPN
jgi:hypothetical protein